MPATPRPMRVALIGYGFAGRVFHAPLIQAIPGLSLEFVASSDAAKVHADLPGVEVIADPLRAATDPRVDLVVIASPNDSHVPLARAALQAGRNVVVDKPFALSLADARELSALAEANGRLLSVFQNRRWDSDFLAVQQAVRDDLIGEVMHLESRIERYRPQVRDRWREAAGPGSGVLWDLAPHLVDQAMQLLGQPDSVYANVAAQRSGALSDDWAHIVLAFGPRRAVLQVGMLTAGAGVRFLVHGTRGTLVKAMPDPQEAQLLAGVRPGDAEWGADTDELLMLFAEEPARRIPVAPGDQSRYYAAVCDALHGRGDNPVTPAQAVAVMAVLEAGVISAREGRAVVPEFNAS